MADFGLAVDLRDEVVRPLQPVFDVVLPRVRSLEFALLAEALEAERERCPPFGAERERVREREVAAAFVLLLERVWDDFDDAERDRGLDTDLLVLSPEPRPRVEVDFDGAIVSNLMLNERRSCIRKSQ